MALEEDILMLLCLLTKSAKKAPEICKWVLDQNIPLKLIECLSPSTSAITKAQSVKIISEFLADLIISVDVIDQFHEPATVSTLFSFITTNTINNTSMVHVVSLLSSVLELQLEGEDSIILLEIIDNIQIFLDFISPSTNDSASFGTSRLAVMQFLLTLVNEEPDISSILIESGFYSMSLQLMFRHANNSILHDLILQFFLLICSRDEEEMKAVFIETQLLDHIAHAWQSKRECQSSKGDKAGQDYSYFGHLAILATVIVDSSEKNDHDSIRSLLNDNKKWQLYVAPYLDEYNLQMISVSTIQ